MKPITRLMIVSVVLLNACLPKAQLGTYICETPMGGAIVDSGKAKIHGKSLSFDFTTQEGDKEMTLALSRCVFVRDK